MTTVVAQPAAAVTIHNAVMKVSTILSGDGQELDADDFSSFISGEFHGRAEKVRTNEFGSSINVLSTMDLTLSQSGASFLATGSGGGSAHGRQPLPAASPGDSTRSPRRLILSKSACLA